MPQFTLFSAFRLTEASGTKLVYDNGAELQVELTGTSFAFDADHGVTCGVTGGAATRVEYFDGSVLVARTECVRLPAEAVDDFVQAGDSTGLFNFLVSWPQLWIVGVAPELC